MTFTPEIELPKVANRATVVEVGGDDALYIYVENVFNMPPQKWEKYLARIQVSWQEKFPNLNIIVGAHDFKFTVISKKLVFAHKLAGNI